MAERLTSTEIELQSRHPILLLGGGSGTGLLLARRLSLEGRIVYIGTRSPEKFNSLRDSVVKSGGREPKPFIADIKNPAETKEAYENMELSEGQVVDYFPFAAGGFEPLMSKIARPLVRLKRELEENGFISKESAMAATKEMSEFTTTESALALANETNTEAPIKLAEHLVKNGHLDSSSTIAVLSSSISKYTDPYNIDIYPGPWLYYPVGRSKAEGAYKLKALSEKLGATFIDIGKDLVDYEEDVANGLPNILIMCKLSGMDRGKILQFTQELRDEILASQNIGASPILARAIEHNYILITERLGK